MLFRKKKPKKITQNPVFSGPDTTGPENFWLSFCRDYIIWNDASMESTIEDASNLYSTFLKPYLADDVQLQLVSYGTSPTFDPARISITSTERKHDGFNVSFTISHEYLNFSDEYVADLLLDLTGIIKLKQIYYVDPFPENDANHLPVL